MVDEAISHLKRGKSDGSSLSSNHFISAAPVLNVFISRLFTVILRHGYIPSNIRDCILQLIPKPGKDPSSSDNYRPIALAPTLSKILEWCILIAYHSAFSTSALQFGFKPGHSADLCTGLVQNVIAKYCFSGSSVFGCFLDASKAFDRVNHALLFDKLIQKGLPPVVNRLLFSWYSDQKSSVLWNNTLSTKFSVTNGVRQGGVLSPILFTVYIDELLLRLESRGIGCFWNHHFVGAVCYADDIVLLSPSASGLRSMLNVCSDFASRHSLIFNASKTQLVRFSLSSDTSNSCSHFLFDGHQLTLSKSANHLGHILSSDLSDDDDILASQRDMCRKANSMLCIFSSANPYVKTKLLKSFCLSLYGSSLWKSSALSWKAFNISFNNILRKVWSLPRTCHTSILHLVSGLHSITNVVLFRSSNLLYAALHSKSSLLADVFSDSCSLIYTSIGYNYVYGYRHRKIYNECDLACANFIRDSRLYPTLNSYLEDEIIYMCSS